MLGKILSIASIGEAIAGAAMTRKFIADLLAVVAMSIVGAIIAGGIVIGCLIEMHRVLEDHGVNADDAAVFTFASALVLLGLIGLYIGRKVSAMRNLPSRTSNGDVITSTIHSVIRGFYRGLTAPPPPKTTYTK